ncbi:MAG TPA: TetR/AcrR family transcriptional regulator, partial [Candidatus Merdenecus merdavium]|nr:TetR/AcrR family transcriptional regulator [Candidatus Merdenecus merdavium]
MSERITPRRLQAEETKKRIYKSALQLFKEKDFEDVTIALICKNAGVSTGHF